MASWVTDSFSIHQVHKLCFTITLLTTPPSPSFPVSLFTPPSLIPNPTPKLNPLSSNRPPPHKATPGAKTHPPPPPPRAPGAGANFWNGGEFYGPPESNSLQLLAAYFKEYPADAEKVVLSIKGGLNAQTHQPDGSAANVRRSVENCVKLLQGTKKLDLFECARLDPNVPLEETVGAMAQCVKDGLIGGISLSEVNANTIRKAHAIHAIAAVEVEMSLWLTNPLENGVAAACAELGIPMIAYSPLGRGFLTGEIKSFDDLPEGDFRRLAPRFQPDVFDKNLELVDELKKLAGKKGCTPAQLALAWVKAYSGKPGLPVIVPIPGATTEARVKENMAETAGLDEGDLAEIGKILKEATIVGHRYPEFLQGHLDL